MTTPEGNVLDKVQKKVNKYGTCIRLGTANGRGWPDVIGCIKGRMLGIEVKANKDGKYTLTQAQLKRLEHLHKSGAIICAVDKFNLADFEYFLSGISASRFGPISDIFGLEYKLNKERNKMELVVK